MQRPDKRFKDIDLEILDTFHFLFALGFTIQGKQQGQWHRFILFLPPYYEICPFGQPYQN